MKTAEINKLESNLPGISWEEYHDVFKGTRLKDKRGIIDENLAPQIRWIATQINAYTDKNIPDIAEEINDVTSWNIYSAARGKAGLRKSEETAMSTTEEVYYGLMDYRVRLQENI